MMRFSCLNTTRLESIHFFTYRGPSLIMWCKRPTINKLKREISIAIKDKTSITKKYMKCKELHSCNYQDK